MYLGDGGRVIGEDSGHQLKRMGVPILGQARLFKSPRQIARWLGLGELLQSFCQTPPVSTHEAPLVRQVPVPKVGVGLFPMKGVMNIDAIRKKTLGNVQNLATVPSVAVFGEMLVHVLLEPVVVPLGRVGRGCR